MAAIEDISLFRKLVELKSFTAVAEAMHLSRSLVSKRINRLEDKLGVQLLNRTTRHLEVTEAGRTYYKYCVQIEVTLQEAEAAVSEIRRHPRGVLNINAPVSYGQMILPEIIARFLVKYPEVKVNLSLSDSLVDVVGAGYDVVIRIGDLNDSSLRARKVGATRLHVFAHKDYLARQGTPTKPEDLKTHNCLIYSLTRGGSINEWRFKGKQGVEQVSISGNLTVDNGMPLYQAVSSGLGIAKLPCFMLKAFDDPEIVYLLPDYQAQEIGIYAIYPPSKTPPINTRVFIDFLAEQLVAMGGDS